MIRSIGLDIVDVSRVERALHKNGERFSKRILGPDELSVLKSRVDHAQFLAGRLAAKEAAIKALGAFLDDRPALSTIQIINEPGGQPSYSFGADVSARLAGIKCHLSISHEKTTAVAVAIFEEEK
ncbi:MAG: holo-ACP synthase [candidate division Zixibacteria bacterium]